MASTEQTVEVTFDSALKEYITSDPNGLKLNVNNPTELLTILKSKWYGNFEKPSKAVSKDANVKMVMDAPLVTIGAKFKLSEDDVKAITVEDIIELLK